MMSTIDSPTLGSASPVREAADLRLSSVAKYAAYGALCVLLSDVSNDTPTAFLVARIVLAGLLYATLLLPVRAGATLLLFIALAGQDIVSGSPAAANYMTAGIWQLSLGPLNPSSVFFACLIYQLVRVRMYRPEGPVRRALVWFLSVPVFTGLVYGGVFTEFGISEYVTDVKFPLMLIGSVVLYGSVLRSQPRWTPQLVAALFGVLFARHFIDLIYLIMNYGPESIAGVSRSSTDSAKGAVNLLILAGLSAVFVGGRHRSVGIAIVVVFGALSIAYATKLIWVALAIGVVVVMFVAKPSRGAVLVAFCPVLIICAAGFLAIINPGSVFVAAARASTVTAGRPAGTFAVDVDYNVVSRIDPIRYGEAVNLMDALQRRGAFLWGTGYAGYYEDSAVDFEERRMGTAYPSYMFRNGEFFLARLFVTHVLLKHGIIGLFVIAAVWIVPGMQLVRILRRRAAVRGNGPIVMVIMVSALAAYLPTSVLHNYWSGKGLFLSGIILALCIHFARERFATMGVERRRDLVVAPSG